MTKYKKYILKFNDGIILEMGGKNILDEENIIKIEHRNPSFKNLDYMAIKIKVESTGKKIADDDLVYFVILTDVNKSGIADILVFLHSVISREYNLNELSWEFSLLQRICESYGASFCFIWEAKLKSRDYVRLLKDLVKNSRAKKFLSLIKNLIN